VKKIWHFNAHLIFLGRYDEIDVWVAKKSRKGNRKLEGTQSRNIETRTTLPRKDKNGKT
jgi:hypothetical protein